METQNLLELLSRLSGSLSRLLDLVNEKQKALVKNDHAALEKCIKSEEQILVNIQTIEEERLRMVTQLNKEFGEAEAKNPITSITGFLKGKIKPEKLVPLSKLEVKIKNDIKEVMKINKQNMFLIQHSRNFITETINSVLSNRKKSILDRKV